MCLYVFVGVCIYRCKLWFHVYDIFNAEQSTKSASVWYGSNARLAGHECRIATPSTTRLQYKDAPFNARQTNVAHHRCTQMVSELEPQHAITPATFANACHTFCSCPSYNHSYHTCGSHLYHSKLVQSALQINHFFGMGRYTE